jgi:GMP synthase-like glutamine amidotransferase
MDVLVVGDRGDDDSGHVGARLLDRGAVLHPLDRDRLPGTARLPAGDLLLLLGSGRSVTDPAQSGVVAAEGGLIRAALDGGMPVLGICYGAQILAAALGGTVSRAPQAEVGWFRHESFDPRLCPPGPWAQFHGDTFAVPPGARLLGSSTAGPQGIAWEAGPGARALGWQFHPEVTATVLAQWLRVETALVEGNADVEAVLADTERLGEPARLATYELTDVALQWLGVVGVSPIQVSATGGSTGS